MWNDGWHSFLWVWMWGPIRGSLGLFWRETHTKGLHARFLTRLEDDEGRKVPELIRAVSRREKSTEVGGSRQSREERRLREPVDSVARFAHVKGWVSVPGGFVGILLEYTLAIAYKSTKCQESVTNFSLLARDCLFFFSSTLSVVYVVFCVSIKKCGIPLAGDERNYSTIWWSWVV